MNRTAILGHLLMWGTGMVCVMATALSLVELLGFLPDGFRHLNDPTMMFIALLEPVTAIVTGFMWYTVRRRLNA